MSEYTPTPSVEKLLVQYHALEKLHESFYRVLVQLRESMVGKQLSLTELADVNYISSRSSKLAEDMRKEMNSAVDFSAQLACSQWMTDSQVTGRADPIRTELCTASPDVKSQAVLPTRKGQPENFAKLIHWLGVPEDKLDIGCISIHWPGLQELVAERTAQGLPLPPGLEDAKTFPKFKVLCKSKKNFSLEEAAKQVAERRPR